MATKFEAVSDRWELATEETKCDWHDGHIQPGEDYLNMLVRVANDDTTGEPEYLTLTICEWCAMMGPLGDSAA